MKIKKSYYKMDKHEKRVNNLVYPINWYINFTSICIGSTIMFILIAIIKSSIVCVILAFITGFLSFGGLSVIYSFKIVEKREKKI